MLEFKLLVVQPLWVHSSPAQSRNGRLMTEHSCATHAGLARVVTDRQAQNGSNMTTEKLSSIFLFSVLKKGGKKRKNHLCEIGLLRFAGDTAGMRVILKFD